MFQLNLLHLHVEPQFRTECKFGLQPTDPNKSIGDISSFFLLSWSL